MQLAVQKKIEYRLKKIELQILEPATLDKKSNALTT